MTFERICELADLFVEDKSYMSIAIQLKNGIQQKLVNEISLSETLDLQNNIVSHSLRDKVIGLCSSCSNPNDELSLYCAAMVAGTILKELDNGNTEYVTNRGLLSIINQF